jgi:SIR2-like domain
MSEYPKELIAAAKERRLLPFIGAGLSADLGLPTWSQLISTVAQDLDMDPDVAALHGDFLQIAECLYLRKQGLGDLRSRLDKEFNNNSIDISKSTPHLLLPHLGAPAIYTTNYDRLIERGFEHERIPYSRVVTLRDLIEADDSRTRVVKFHGDFSRDDSLVLTESQYFDRLNFDKPLDIRLRSDLIGKTVLFLGYGFGDVNVRYMWYQMTKLMHEEATQSFIVAYRPNPIL